MLELVTFIGAVIWGAFSAQLLVQTIFSFCSAWLCLIALPFSRVKKEHNAAGAVAYLAQSFLFGIVFVAGSWISSNFVDYESWNVNSIAGLVVFLGSIICMLPQMPGKILLARRCAWEPSFMEAVNCQPRSERVAFAKKV